MPQIFWTSLPAPIGVLHLAASGEGVCCVDLAAGEATGFLAALGNHGITDVEENEAALRPYAREFEEYFNGRRRQFSIAAAPLWGTEFQRRVWAALLDIPYGETRSYGELARRIGRPKAVRAVGRANGANPIPIVAPCHRVIGRDGSLTGFASGLARKEWLLRHEGAAIPTPGNHHASPRLAAVPAA